MIFGASKNARKQKEHSKCYIKFENNEWKKIYTGNLQEKKRHSSKINMFPTFFKILDDPFRLFSNFLQKKDFQSSGLPNTCFFSSSDINLYTRGYLRVSWGIWDKLSQTN